ncbi:MAG: CBS domain-containing protein [Planctomycetaceae bacterium]
MATTSKPAPQARDFMTRHVHTISADASLAEVISFLDRHQISNAPVVEQDEGGHSMLVGFLSEGDCLEHLSNEVFFGSPFQAQTARTMMKRHPVCVEPETDIFSLASIFVSHRYRHLPVVEEGRLLGVVSRRDILKALDEFYREDQESRTLRKVPRDLREVINLRFVADAK